MSLSCLQDLAAEPIYKGVNASGVIAFSEQDVASEDVSARLEALGYQDCSVTTLDVGEFLMPGSVQAISVSTVSCTSSSVAVIVSTG